jgi:hypothetical protein
MKKQHVHEWKKVVVRRIEKLEALLQEYEAKEEGDE